MRTRTLLAFGNFFSVAHFYLIIYILAPYLATFLPADETGLVVSAGALATLAIFPSAPAIVARSGAKRLAIAFGVAEAIVLLLLAFNPLPVLAIILAALACAMSPLIAYGLDLLLEVTVAKAEEGSTGRVRTAYLTAGNAALIIAPIAAGFLLGTGDAYGRVFLLAGLSLIPFIALFLSQKFPEGHIPARAGIGHAWRTIRKNPDLTAITGANAVLQFFYHLAPLYIPLYLHNELGISWESLGWMFSVMLIPFVLIEYPAGVMSDRWLGDKFLLVTGFVIAGISFGMLGFVTGSTSVFVILIILVATRVGGALVESMTEGHFFRKVSERDADQVGVFRMARPFAALLAPLIGSVLLAIAGYTWLFLLSGLAILVIGGFSALRIKDVDRAAETFSRKAPPSLPS